MGWQGIKFQFVPLCAVALLCAAIFLSGCGGDGGEGSSAQAEASGTTGATPAMAEKEGAASPIAQPMGDGGGAGAPMGTQIKNDGGNSPWMGARGASALHPAVHDAANQDSVDQSTAQEPQAYAFDYTVRSASAMPVGARVSLVRADISGSCILPDRVSAFSPVASGAVTNAGSVTLLFNDTRNRPFVEIIYIDSNDSGHLDAGDRVWGSNPKDPAGICFSPDLAGTNRVDWDGVAAVIGGSAIYSGDLQDFLAAAAGESQILVGSLIIGETGYENL